MGGSRLRCGGLVRIELVREAVRGILPEITPDHKPVAGPGAERQLAGGDDPLLLVQADQEHGEGAVFDAIDHGVLRAGRRRRGRPGGLQVAEGA